MTANFVAGHYTATYNSKAVGQTEDGFRIDFTVLKRIVTGDQFGQTPQDGIYLGQEVFVQYTIIEPEAAGIDDIRFPYSDTVGTPWEVGVCGTMDVRGAGTGSPTSKALSLVLTAVSGTTAANDAEATVTFPLTILAENFPISMLLGNDLRSIPIRQRVYPNVSTDLFGTET
jgi:hypothetical protein